MCDNENMATQSNYSRGTLLPTKIDFTKHEFDEFMAYSKTADDVIRLVDPVEQRVCLTSEGADPSDMMCSSIWGRCERCDNCTSLRALQSEGIAHKMEILVDRTYWITSRYVRIDGAPHIMEMVTDFTENLLLESDQLNEVGRIISNYNRQLITDPLTGIYNRRFLDEDFLPSLDCCHEKGVALDIAIMDLDDFKLVNDTYGHQAGDALLRDVAGYWKRRFNSRRKEAERLVVRYGGDEMIIAACGMPADKFRAEVTKGYEQMRKICYYSHEVQIPFSISFGIASSDELGDDWTWEQLLAIADRRLYDEKQKS